MSHWVTITVALVLVALTKSSSRVLAFSATTVVLPSSSSAAPPTLDFSSSSSTDGVPTTKYLENLLEEFPGTERYCSVGATRFGRGLVAIRDLQPGQLALRIPLECAIVESDPDRNEDEWTGRLANRLMEYILPYSSSSSSTLVGKNHPIMIAYAQTLPEPPSTPARGDWSEEIILKEFDHDEFVAQIHAVQDWRYRQWEAHCGDYAERRQTFLNALDLTCSRTIRLGDDVMLVPFLDMANHASQEEGGGYFQRQEDSICLRVGERGVQKGEEVTLDYGSRSNEDWLLHYGFLPHRNSVESVTLPDSKRIVTWQDVRTTNDSLRKECQKYLEESATSLEEDLEILRNACRHSSTRSHDHDFRLETAVQYRINRKSLLSAVSGQPQTSPFFSAFGSTAEIAR